MTLRLTKILLCCAASLFTLCVTCNNILDYRTNFHFVQHVLSMDTTRPDTVLRVRALNAPILWHIAYCIIIGCEGITSLLLLHGTFLLYRARHRDGEAFDQSKRQVIRGLTLGFLLWFLGFMTIGGEWFVMWQSPTWNGQHAAFEFYITLLGVLIIVSHRDPDLPSR